MRVFRVAEREDTGRIQGVTNDGCVLQHRLKAWA